MKYLTLLAVVLLIPAQAAAMTWPVWGSIHNAVPAATRFYPCISGTGVAQTAAINARTPVSTNFSFGNARFDIDAQPGAGNSVTAQLFVDGVGTSISMTVSDTDRSATDADTVAITAGQTCYWQVSIVGTPGTPDFSIGASATGATDGEFTISGGSNGTVANNANMYLSPGLFGIGTTTQMDASLPVPLSGTIDNLYVELDGTPGGAATYTVNVWKNDTPTSITCQVASAATTCTDLSASTGHTLSITAGDYLTVETVPSAGPPTARRVRFSLRVQPTTNGQSIVWNRATNVGNTGNRSQAFVAGGLTGNNTVGLATTTAPIGFTLSNLYATALATGATGPGVGKSWGFMGRINSANTTLQATTTGATATTTSDTTHSDTVVAGDFIEWKTAPIGTPSAIYKLTQAAVAYIAPTASTVTGRSFYWLFDS